MLFEVSKPLQCQETLTLLPNLLVLVQPLLVLLDQVFKILNMNWFFKHLFNLLTTNNTIACASFF